LKSELKVSRPGPTLRLPSWFAHNMGVAGRVVAKRGSVPTSSGPPFPIHAPMI
jgi:hypothetical protein